MTRLTKFLPLEKMEEQTDGTLHVYGIVTAEQPDLDSEVCDYAGTKERYEQRAAENLKKTSIPGMTPSLMPFREMHRLITQGAGRTLDCDDASKTIRMGFHVVDAEAVKKWKAGCFVGFSQGGDYIKRWPDPEFPGCTRYIADPHEVSAVDTPCLPVALVESMKGRTVQLAKAGGVVEEVPLQVAVAQVAKEMPASGGEGEDAVKITNQQGLTKAARTLHEHLSNLAEKHEAMGEHLRKCHEAEMHKHASVAEHIEKCIKACKDAMEGEEPEAADKAASSSLVRQMEELQRSFDAKLVALTETLAKTPAAGIPHTGILRESRVDMSAEDAELFKGVKVERAA